MAYQVTLVTEANLDLLITQIQQATASGWRCSVWGPAHPTKVQMQYYMSEPTRFAVVAAHDGGDLGALAVVKRANAKVVWLICPKKVVVPAGQFILSNIRTNLGMNPWGRIDNPDVAANVAKIPGMVKLDDGRMEFQG